MKKLIDKVFNKSTRPARVARASRMRPGLEALETRFVPATIQVTTFADGLNIPMGIYPWKGGCVAFSIPNIWHFEDTDGDGKADKMSTFVDDLNAPTGFQFYKDGVLVITAQRHRTRERNRADAMERLLTLIREAAVPPPPMRRPTKPTRGSKERRLEDKTRRSSVKIMRGRPTEI